MLANVNREENIASPYIPDGEDLLSSTSPAQKGFKIAELTDVEGDFPWDSETNQPGSYKTVRMTVFYPTYAVFRSCQSSSTLVSRWLADE